MKLVNWLFGIYKRSYALQLMLIVLVGIHVVILGGAYVAWLLGVLYRWTA